MTAEFRVAASVREQHAAGATAFRVHIPVLDRTKPGDNVVVIDREGTRCWGTVLAMEASPHPGCKAIVFLPDAAVTYE